MNSALELRLPSEDEEEEFLRAHHATTPDVPNFLHYYDEGMSSGALSRGAGGTGAGRESSCGACAVDVPVRGTTDRGSLAACPSGRTLNDFSCASAGTSAMPWSRSSAGEVTRLRCSGSHFASRASSSASTASC